MSKEHVRNSTKGSAIPCPESYKKDAYTQTWVDSRDLATLSNWLDSNGYNTRHLSEVVRFTIELAVECIVRESGIERIEFTEDARNMLEAKYNANLNPSGRGKRNVMHNLVLDDRKKGEYNLKSKYNWNLDSSPQKDVKVINSANNYKSKHEDRYDLDEAFRRADEERVKEMKKQREKEIERFKANCVVDENGVYSYRGTHSGIVVEKDMKEYEEREKKRERMEEIDKREKALDKKKEKMNEKEIELSMQLEETVDEEK